MWIRRIPWTVRLRSNSRIQRREFQIVAGRNIVAAYTKHQRQNQSEIANDRLPPSESEINKPLLRFGKQEQRFLVIRRSRVSGMR